MAMQNFNDGVILYGGSLDNTFAGLSKQIIIQSKKSSRATNYEDSWINITGPNLDDYSDPNTSTTNYKTYQSPAIGSTAIYFAKFPDKMNDNSLNANYWTTYNGTGGGSFIEASSGTRTGHIYTALTVGSVVLTFSGANAIDFKSTGSDSVLLIHYSVDSHPNLGAGGIYIGENISGTNSVYVGDGTVGSYLSSKVVIDYSEGRCSYFADANASSPTTSGLNISGLSRWYFQLCRRMNSVSSSSQNTLYEFGYITSAGSSVYATGSDVLNISGTASSMVCNFFLSGASGAYTPSVSMNGGNNLTEVTPFYVVSGVVGSMVQFKIIGNYPDVTLVDGNFDVPRLTGIAGFYQ